jgi:nitrate/nitrite transport system permease protein
VVLDAYGGIVTFHNREYTKLADFTRSGESREKELAEVKQRVAELDSQSAAVNETFTKLERKREKLVAIKLAPYEAAIEKQRAAYRAARDEREKLLLASAAKIPSNDAPAKEAYKEDVRMHIEQSTKEQNHLNELRSQLGGMRGEKWAPLELARDEKNALEQEQQFLKKRMAYLTSDNRENKVIDSLKQIKLQERDYANADGEQLYAMATKIVKSEERVMKVAKSEYAKPPTFFDQIYTSVKCVFLGFVIATAIAIPVGVLCGLNRVFMASAAPLISLFKPVSPIVWLPIVFIIVGGFIKVPEDAWIPPAFLSTAITVALCSLWPTLVNTALGVASIDQDHMNVARVLATWPLESSDQDSHSFSTSTDIRRPQNFTRRRMDGVDRRRTTFVESWIGQVCMGHVQ